MAHGPCMSMGDSNSLKDYGTESWLDASKHDDPDFYIYIQSIGQKDMLGVGSKIRPLEDSYDKSDQHKIYMGDLKCATFLAD